MPFRLALIIGCGLLAGCATARPAGAPRPFGDLRVGGDDYLTQSLIGPLIDAMRASGRGHDAAAAERVQIVITRNVEPTGPAGRDEFRYSIRYENGTGGTIGELVGRCSVSTANLCARRIVARAPH